MTVLLVEDEADLLLLIKELLEELGLRVLGAQNLKEADAFLNSHHIDLLICDVVLAGARQGLQFINQFQKRFPKCPFVVVTGMAARFEPELSKVNPQNILYKPFDISDLIVKVDTLLNRRSP